MFKAIAASGLLVLASASLGCKSSSAPGGAPRDVEPGPAVLGCQGAACEWTIDFGDGLTPDAIAIDRDGAVYVAGEQYADIDVGCGPLARGAADGYTVLFKVDAAGKCVFQAQVTELVAASGGDSGDVLRAQPEALAVDDLGNVYVVGTSSIDFTFHGASIASNGAFAISYGSDGTERWGLGSSDLPNGQLGAVATSDDGGVFISGFGIGTGSRAVAGMPVPNDTAYVARLDQDANGVWVQSFGNGGEPIQGVTVAPSGDVLTSGAMKKSDLFGPANGTSAPALGAGVCGNGIAAKLDPQHGKTAGFLCAGYDITAVGEVAGGLVVSGLYKAGQDVGGVRLKGDTSYFAARYDAQAHLAWASPIVYGSVAVSPLGQTVLVGDAPLAFGGETLAAPSGFVVALVDAAGKAKVVTSIPGGAGGPFALDAWGFGAFFVGNAALHHVRLGS